jgi:hypothetical protein
MEKSLTSLISEAVKLTGGCQRNWDYDYSIPQEHIDTIVNTAIDMPTKQNQEFYSLVASTDQKFNHEFYLKTFTDDKGLYNEGRNSQTNAPLLLIWIRNKKFKKKENTYEEAGPVSIGVSAGATALVANMLGYKTGFCACINKKKSIPMLAQKNIFTTDIELALGIGMPDTDMPGRNFVKFPHGMKEFQKRIKNIKVYTI